MTCREIAMGLTKVTRNYRITLTKNVRKALEIKVGDFVLVNASRNELIIQKV